MRLSIVIICALYLTWMTYTWLTATKAVDDLKVVCYFTSPAPHRTGNRNIDISDIDPTLCTHLIYAFVGVTEDGDVTTSETWVDLPDDGGEARFQEFNALRNRSPGTKMMVSVGGWSHGSIRFSNIVGNSLLRSTFARNIVRFVLKYGFDGCDIDWEYPNQRGGVRADVENLVLLLKELRSLFDEHNLTLSVTTGAVENCVRLSYNVLQICKYPDFVNLMAYEYEGVWEATTGHNAPVFAASRETKSTDRSLNVNASINYWLGQGAIAKKLILGTAFYGKSFTLTDPAQHVPGSPISGAGKAGPYTQENGILGYNEICEFVVDKWTVVWDEEQHVSYAYAGDQWISYDDVRSITEKAEYVKKMGLGGAMLWSINTDDFLGICGRPYPLLRALNRVLRPRPHLWTNVPLISPY